MNRGPNIEAILQVAAAIESHAIPDLGFNMADYKSFVREDLSGHYCQTTACIGGWAVAVLDPEGFEDYSYGSMGTRAARLLNLSRVDQDKLFGVIDEDGDNLLPIDLEEIPLSAAVKVLRTFGETGKIDWSAALAP